MENNICFHVGGQFEHNGEVTLNCSVNVIPVHAQSRLSETNLATKGDLRIWNPIAEQWEWRKEHPVLDPYTRKLTDSLGSVPQGSPLIRPGQVWSSMQLGGMAWRIDGITADTVRVTSLAPHTASKLLPLQGLRKGASLARGHTLTLRVYAVCTPMQHHYHSPY